MAELGDRAERALWRRFYTPGGTKAPAPDVLALAAYAEGGLSEAAAEPIEHWLASHPELLNDALADLAAAHGLTPASIYVPDEAIIANACALLSDDATGKIVPFRRNASSWRTALAWSSIAASLMVASLGGFAMGSDAYQNLSLNTGAGADTASADSFDVSATLVDFSDDSGT
jgi:hypothetical protein